MGSDNMVASALPLVLYGLTGIGLYGAYRHLPLLLKLLYGFLFPAHWAAFAYCRAVRRDIRWISFPCGVMLAGVVCWFSDEGTRALALVLFVPLLLWHLFSDPYEKESLF